MTNKRDMSFADRLQRVMDEQGLTRSDLARKMWGTIEEQRGDQVYSVPRNRQTIGRYLEGTQSPGPSTKRKLADVLGVSYATLFPMESPVNRAGSGISMSSVSAKEATLDIHLRLPIDVAMEVIKIVGPYAS